MDREYTLNKRQQKILKIIVNSHIQYAVPIGSSFVSDTLDLSSATIRNVMGELEEMGYLSKPHTSAGRLPTTAGYRYYVNNLIDFNPVSNRQKRFIEEEYYRKKIESIEAMLEKISHILAIMTRYAGIACVSNLKFYMEGTSNMIDMPEFKNPKRMRMLLKLFDEKAELLKLLSDDLTTDGIKIHIGEEDRFEDFKDLGLVTANYRIRGSRKGSLGVLGPMRMNYSTLVPIVDFLARTIEVVLNDMEIE
jgi:transcriptional regulator of heat shock response